MGALVNQQPFNRYIASENVYSLSKRNTRGTDSAPTMGQGEPVFCELVSWEEEPKER